MRLLAPSLLVASLLALHLSAAQAQSPKSSPAAIEQYRVAAEFQKLEQYDLAAKEWAKLAREHGDDPLAAAGRHYAGVCEFQLAHYDQAMRWLEEFVAKHPQHELLEPSLTNLGLAAYNQAQRAEGQAASALYQRAADVLSDQLQKFPDGKLAAEAGFYRGEALYAVGKRAEAAQAYADWLKQHADHALAPNVQLALGATQVELGNTDAAVATLQKLLNAKPAADIAAQAWVRLGDARTAQQQYQQAADAYARALATNADSIDADYVRRAQASAVFNGGDYAAAAKTYDQQGDAAGAGKAYYQAGDYQQAADRLAKAYAATPDDADLAHWWVRALIDGGQAEQAIAAADRALAKVKSSVLLLDKADAMYSIDARRGESVAVYLEAASAAEGDLAAEAQHLAAATALELGEFETAQRVAAEVVAEHPDSSFAADARLTLAEAQLQSGAAKDAVATFAQLLKTASDDARRGLALRLAWAESTAGDEQAVVETLRPVLDGFEGADAEQARFLLGRAEFRTGDVATAVSTLQPFAQQSPPGPWTLEGLLLLGRSHYANNRSDEAQRVFTLLIDSSPQPQLAAQAYYWRAQADQGVAQVDGAIADYTKVFSNWPDHPLAPYAEYRAATLHMNKGLFEAAAAGFGKLIAKHPDHALVAEAKLSQATCLERAGNTDAALSLLDGMDQGDPRVLLTRGTSLAAEQKWDEAIAALTSATQAKGEFADRDRAWYELAWAHREAGHPEQARDAFSELITNFDSSPLAADAQFRIGESYYDEGKYSEAAPAFAMATGDTPVGEKAMHMQAWALHKAGDNAAAADVFEQQLVRYVHGELASDAKWMLGEARFADGSYEQAIEAYTKAAQGESSAESLAPLGMLHAAQAAGQLDKWQDAARWLQQAIEKYPDYAGRHQLDCELGWALTKLEQPNEAMPLLAKVADGDTSPVGARARFLVGELQFAAEEYEAAVRSFFKVSYGYGDRQAPEPYHAWQAESLFEAARCLEQLDRSGAAKKLYAELIDRFPQEPKAELARRRLDELDP